MSVPSLILDLGALILVVAMIAYCAHKGFFASLLNIGGTLLSVVAAYFVANKSAPVLFEKLFRNNLYDKTVTTMNEQAGATLGEILDKIVSFLP